MTKVKERVLSRENLGFLLAKASQRWNEALYERFCREGFREVRPAFGSILLPLFEEDGLRIGELARRARLSKQTLTTLVRMMEARLLVLRRADPEDRRAFRIYLTARSRRFKRSAGKVLAELEQDVERELPPQQVAKLKSSLETLMELGRFKEKKE